MDLYSMQKDYFLPAHNLFIIIVIVDRVEGKENGCFFQEKHQFPASSGRAIAELVRKFPTPDRIFSRTQSSNIGWSFERSIVKV